MLFVIFIFDSNGVVEWLQTSKTLLMSSFVHVAVNWTPEGLFQRSIKYFKILHLQQQKFALL